MTTSDTPAAPATAVPAKQQMRPVFKVLYYLVLGVMAVCFAAWFFGPSNSGSSAPAASNKLDRALQLGVSTRADFQAFQDDGGLNNPADNTWLGFGATSVSTSYDSAGHISTIDVIIQQTSADGKFASPNALKTALASLCTGTWTSTGNAYSSDSGKVNCVMSVTPEKDQIEVVIIES